MLVEMERRLQAVLTAVVIAILIIALAYSYAILQRPSKATITCSIHADEGTSHAFYHMKIYPVTMDHWPYYTWDDITDEKLDDVQPGTTIEVIMTHEWKSDAPSRLSMEINLNCLVSGDLKHFMNGFQLEVIPGGDYSMQCWFSLSEDDDELQWSITVEQPTLLDPFSSFSSGELQLSLYNHDPDSDIDYDVIVNGYGRAFGLIGPLSWCNLTIDVPWEWPETYQCPVEVHGGSPTPVYSDTVVIDDGATTSVEVIM